jgi:hypothetical protein
MCEHLQKLEDHLRSLGVTETWRGQPWSENCREWIYFECVLSVPDLKEKLGLEPFVTEHDYYDLKAGSELGLVCEHCDDGIMGVHPDSSMALMVPRIG